MPPTTDDWRLDDSRLLQPQPLRQRHGQTKAAWFGGKELSTERRRFGGQADYDNDDTGSGYSEPPQAPAMYGLPRTMLPPSPQHYPAPRYSQPPLPANSATVAVNNGAPLPHKRPGSSMSISSMLGSEPEKPAHEQYHAHNQPSRPPSAQLSHPGPSMSLGAVMSPPQYPTKQGPGEYSYKPRSKTPDRMAGTALGPRPHRSSSGTMTQRPGPFYEPPRSGPSQVNMNLYSEPRYTPPFGPTVMPKDEFEDRARRTSLGGILQRPESQPQPTNISPPFPPTSHPPARPESIPPSLPPIDRTGGQPMGAHDPPRSNGLAGPYDTRPPSLPTLSRLPQTGHPPQPVSAPHERSATQSLSPEIRRTHLNSGEGRLAGILNQQGEPIYSAPNMMRQDSVQSLSDRSVLGDRLRTNRAYSPFAGSVASGPLEEQVRKGSEELSQHRAILGLANESKRGRYSPVPQAVQGAQAHTPVPDAGIKTEHGRVFAGIGSGLGSTSAGPTPAPQNLPASPFKRDEGGVRLSEENLMKMSRSSSGISKRNRKVLDEDVRAESDVGDVKKSGSGRGKRSKYSHTYKLDLEDTPPGQRKNGTFPTSNPVRRAGTPTSNPTQLLHNPQIPRPSSASGRSSAFKPKKVIRISSVVAQARRNPRRHLGFFKYEPVVGVTDFERPQPQKFDVSIRPNLLPSFKDPDQINCTYTVKVSSMWLQQKERNLIGCEQYLWGSGIYTDDSDPVAAAMHSGFIQSAHIEDPLLNRLIDEQNPRIEGLSAPDTPAPVPEGKDLHITLIVLPQLENYADSVRFGIKSRSWPEPSSENSTEHLAPHDGVSFMVLKTQFLDDGVSNRRLGRTGEEKRKRLREELADRKRGLDLMKEKIALARAKEKERLVKSSRRRKEPHSRGEKDITRTEERIVGNKNIPDRLHEGGAGKENHLPTKAVAGQHSEDGENEDRSTASDEMMKLDGNARGPPQQNQLDYAFSHNPAMATASSYTRGQHVQEQNYRSRMVPDVAVRSIEKVGFPGVNQKNADPARPLRVKQEVEDDVEKDDFDGENWLDADEDVLRARLRARGLKLDDIPLF
ncbi:hypothetical protein AYL99_07038 [Fonsecaea erecta]|uniref:Histone deacetylation protein Rxt3 n=1 Tax=Fonsecaea erecta TaxID=1367422 RepID=A0A178ZDV6_9EURO|nr:hypothetical protein AYL99_07038 [Fonsecaea erecta]OAP57948.1 hypothetical protein AYL99_07038 [Fonsecaea erecta]